MFSGFTINKKQTKNYKNAAAVKLLHRCVSLLKCSSQQYKLQKNFVFSSKVTAQTLQLQYRKLVAICAWFLILCKWMSRAHLAVQSVFARWRWHTAGNHSVMAALCCQMSCHVKRCCIQIRTVQAQANLIVFKKLLY